METDEHSINSFNATNTKNITEFQVDLVKDLDVILFITIGN